MAEPNIDGGELLIEPPVQKPQFSGGELIIGEPIPVPRTDGCEFIIDELIPPITDEGVSRFDGSEMIIDESVPPIIPPPVIPPSVPDFTNFVSDGDTYGIVAIQDYIGGDKIVSGQLVGVTKTGAKTGGIIDITLVGSYKWLKDNPADVIPVGTKIWIDPITLKVKIADSGGDVFVGKATILSPSGQLNVMARLEQ